MAFNLVNGTLVGTELARGGPHLHPETISLEALTGGLLLFFLGLSINMSADTTLLKLRRSPGDKQYYIPRGGLFEYVARPSIKRSSWYNNRIDSRRRQTFCSKCTSVPPSTKAKVT